MDWLAFAATAITAILAFLGTYLSNRRAAAVNEYRLEQVERKLDKHNNLVERMYKCEETVALHEAELNRVNHRLGELEKKGA